MAGKTKKINVKMIIDTEFNNAKTQIDNITSGLSKVKAPQSLTKDIKAISSGLQSFKNGLQDIQDFKLTNKNFNAFEQKISNLPEVLKKAQENLNKIKTSLPKVIKEVSAKQKDALAKLNKMTNYTFDPKLTGKQALGENATEEDLRKYKKLKTELTRVTNQLTFLTQMSSEVNRLDNSFENFNGTIEVSKNALKEAQTQLNYFNQQEASNSIKNLANRFLGLSAVAYIGRQAFQQFKTTIVELDKDLTAIAAVTGKTREQMWGMVDTYNEMAQELGTTTQQIAQSAKLYYQQGRTQSEVTDLVKQTAILATTAEIDYTAATNYLTAAINGYNIAADEAYKVTDSWSALAAASAVDVKELAVAMSKVASLAAASGVELETASAFLSKMLETTREAPENLGTALKTIISRFQDLKMSEEELEDGVDANQVEKALKSAGVELRDSLGQFRDFDDVLMDLSKVWDGLSINTQKYIATIAAGSRQQSRFIALVSDYERNLELIDIAQDSTGASTAQFNIFLTGLQASFNRLKAAWEGFYTSFEQGPSLFSAILDILAGLLNTLTTFGPLNSSLVITLGAVAIKLVANAAAYKLSQKAIEAETAAKIANIEATEAATTAEGKAAIAKLKTTQIIAANAGVWSKTAGTVLSTIAPYAGYIAIIGAVVVGLIAAVTWQERHIKKLKEEKEALQAQSTQMQQSVRSIQSLKEEYITAAKAGEDLSVIQQKLEDSFPDLAAEIDLTSASLREGTKALDDYTLQMAKISAGTALAAIAKDREIFEQSLSHSVAYQDTTYRRNGKDYSYEEYEAAFRDSYASEKEFQLALEGDASIVGWFINMPDGTRLGPFKQGYEAYDAAKEYELDSFKPDATDVAKLVAYFDLEAEINDKSLEESAKAALENFYKTQKENSEYFDQVKDENGEITYSLNETGIEAGWAIVEKSDEYLKALVEEYLNAGFDLENASKMANNALSKFWAGDGYLSREEFDLLSKILPKDLAEKLDEYFSNAEEELQTRIENLYDGAGSSKVQGYLDQIVQNSGTKGAQAFLDAFEQKIEEGTDQEFLSAIANLNGVELSNGDFTINQDSILAAAGDTMASFELMSEVIENFGTEGEEVQVVLKALSQSINGLGLETEEVANGPLNDMVSIWDDLEKAITDGVDEITKQQLITELGLSEEDFYFDETTAMDKLPYDTALKWAKAHQEIALEKTRNNIASLELKKTEIESELQMLRTTGSTNDATAARYNLAAATRAAELAEKGLSAEEDALYLSMKAKAAEADAAAAEYDKQRIAQLEKESTAIDEQLSQAKSREKILESSTFAENYFSNAIDGTNDALDKQKEALENSKKALEDQKKALEDARDAAKDYADMLADAIKNRLEKELEKAESAVENYYDALNQALEELIDNATDELDKLQQAAEDVQNLAEENADALQEQADLVIDFYNKQIEAIQAKIDASQEEADALERLQKLQEARDAYEQAKQKTRLVLIEGAGWRFRTDKDALTEAGESLATTETENQNELLEQQIEALENIKAKWEEIAENIGKATSELEKTANFQAFLESRSPDQLDDLYNQFAGSVGQNNALFENALQAQNKYEEQNNANAEGTLAWQIAQWQQAQEQAELDQNQFDILTDPNAKAVEELKQQLLQQLGSASGESIQNVLSNGLQITIENAEKVNAINDTLDALEELLNKMDMTSEEIAEYNNIQNMVGQASLEALLEGGSVYGQLENEINEIISLNDQISFIESQISVLQGQIDALDDNINSVKDTIKDGVKTTGDYITSAAGDIVDAIGNMKVEVNMSSPYGSIRTPADIPQAAVGGVQDEGEYLRVHGTKNRPELVLNNSQAAGLFKFIDSLTRMPSILASLPSLAKNESSQTINNEEGLSFQNCVFEIKTDSDNLEGLISDLKRQVPFK